MSTLYGSLYLFWNLKKVPEKDNVLWPYHVSKSCISNFCLFVCLFKGLDSVSGSPEPQHVSYYWTKISSWLLDAGKEQWGQESLARAPCHWCWGNLIKKLSPWTCFLHSKVFILLWAFISSTIGCFLQDSILKITIRYFSGGGVRNIDLTDVSFVSSI